MNPFSKTIYFLLLSSVLLMSCGLVIPVVTATESMPTNTIVSTRTSVPEPSPTATLSKGEEIFTIPTMPAGPANTPTPIATPALASSSIKLKDLSEEDALDLIHEMNEYSYQNFPSFQDWWTDGYFIASQEPVALAIQEYLYRFPESPDAGRLRWQLAFINSIMYDGLPGNQYGDEWMMDELEKSLNQGETSPDQLESVLDRYWFDTPYIQPLENLFGDGTTGWLYQVVPQIWEGWEHTGNRSVYDGSLFFVAHKDNKNEFKIYLLRSAWNLSFGTSYVFDVTDHNKNGLPEIALYTGGHGGTMCSGNLFIYEWNDTIFAELTKSELYLRDCSENFEYSEMNGTPAIIFYRIFPSRKEQYIWNGDTYEFSRYIDATPLKVWHNSAGSRLSYQEEAQLISEILASSEVPGNRAAFSDYLRYRLGIIYAFDAKSSEAIRELQDLVSSPRDPTRTIFPAMARKFLEKYKEETGLYDACHQARLVYDNAFEVVRALNGPAEDEKYQEIFGFPYDPPSFAYLPTCDEEEAFRRAVNSISTTMENIPTELGKMGVAMDYSQRIDADLDGKTEEWLIVFDEDRWYLVFPDGLNYGAEVMSAPNGFWDKQDGLFLQVTSEFWNSLNMPVMTIQLQHDLTIMQVNDDFTTTSLLEEYGVMKSKMTSHNNIPQVQIFYQKPEVANFYIDDVWHGYRWEETQNIFKPDLLEYTLFILHDPAQGVEIAEGLLPTLNDWKTVPDMRSSLPYHYYLLGLSYELSGDRQNAAQIYWQLWHDFPESHYALMARYKLEPATP